MHSLSASTPSRPVAGLLAALHLAPRQAHKALTLWPLLREAHAPLPPAASCAPLAAAVDRGDCIIEDATGGAPCPRVRLDNLGRKPVLVVAGDELRGFADSWRARKSCLVAAGGRVVLDAALARERPRQRAVEIAEILESFHTLENQVGFVAAIGDEVAGLEYVASPALLRRLFARLLGAYAARAAGAAWRNEAGRRLDAMERRLRFSAPEPFLRALSRAHSWRAPSVGAGDALEIEGAGLCARALDAGGIVHLTATLDTGAAKRASLGRLRPALSSAPDGPFHRTVAIRPA